MNAQDFKDAYMAKNIGGGFSGPNIAATPEEMRNLLDSFVKERKKGNVSAKAFNQGMLSLSIAGMSPNSITREIKNILKVPGSKFLVDNPELAEELGRKSLPLLTQFGVDPKTAEAYLGPGMDILQQAKKDGLLRPDVTDEQVANEIQKPLYSALQGWMNKHADDPKIDELFGSRVKYIKNKEGEDIRNPEFTYNPTIGNRPLPRQRAYLDDFLSEERRMHTLLR